MRFLLILGAIMLPIPAATAQTFEGNDATVGSQWRANDATLNSYIGNGYRVAGVTQQLTQSDRGIVNVTSYFLQKETSFVRCNELIIPAPAPPKGKDANKDTKETKKVTAPTVVLGCSDVAAPGPVPFSTKPAAGFEAILPGH